MIAIQVRNFTSTNRNVLSCKLGIASAFDTRASHLRSTPSPTTLTLSDERPVKCHQLFPYTNPIPPPQDSFSSVSGLPFTGNPTPAIHAWQQVQHDSMHTHHDGRSTHSTRSLAVSCSGGGGAGVGGGQSAGGVTSWRNLAQDMQVSRDWCLLTWQLVCLFGQETYHAARSPVRRRHLTCDFATCTFHETAMSVCVESIMGAHQRIQFNV